MLEELERAFGGRKDKPSPNDWVLYLFFEHGISYEEFKKLPLPYIFSVVKTYSYVKEKEKKMLSKKRGSQY